MSIRLGPGLACVCTLAAACLAPGLAVACPDLDPCWFVEAWESLTPVNGADIAADGVLVLKAGHTGTIDDDALAELDLVVTRDGEPVPGALETTPLRGVLVWRPDQPWQPAVHRLTATAPPAPEGCTAGLAVDTELSVTLSPSSSLRPPEFTGETTVSLHPFVVLEALACCVDAPVPVRTETVEPGCAVSFHYDYDRTMCTLIDGTGMFSIELTGTPAVDGPRAGQVLYTLLRDGEPQTHSLAPGGWLSSLEEPTCVAFTVTDLATGASVTGPEQCFGEDLVGRLGPQRIDPSEALSCPEIHQCVSTGTTWDTTMCEIVATNRGCGCTTAPTSTVLLVPGLLVLRRRRTTRRRC